MSRWCIILVFLGLTAWSARLDAAQGPASSDPLARLISQWNLEEKVPDGLLAQKSLVVYGTGIGLPELEQAQQGFQRTGIDAVLHLPADLVFAAPEVTQQVTEYMVKREIRFIIVLRRKEQFYELVFAPFNGTSGWVTPGHSAWRVTGGEFRTIFESIGRVSASSQKKKNLLINEWPETEFVFQPIGRERNLNFMYRLNQEPLGVVRTGEAAFDEVVESTLREIYPYKVIFFEPLTPVKDMRAKKCLFVLRVVHTRASEAVRLLGFPASKDPQVVSGITFDSGKEAPSSVASGSMVWKFFIQQTDNNALYLGNRWDADTDRIRALRNHLSAFRAWVNRK